LVLALTLPFFGSFLAMGTGAFADLAGGFGVDDFFAACAAFFAGLPDVPIASPYKWNNYKLRYHLLTIILAYGAK
jgi:hypothetical protein